MTGSAVTASRRVAVAEMEKVAIDIGRALVRDGRLAAWGVVRPCRTGFKIGPLVADDRAAAEAVLAALLAAAGGGEIFLDVPRVNRDTIESAMQMIRGAARSMAAMA